MNRAAVNRAVSRAVTIAVLAGLGVCGLNLVTAEAATRGAPGPAVPYATDGKLGTFRVDVSRYPRVGVVVTVPAAGGPLNGADFTVITGTRSAEPDVRQLSPDDIELALAPDTQVPAASLPAERAAATWFLVRLPQGAKTGVVNPSQPGMAPHLTGDPAFSVAAALTDGPSRPPAVRLAQALAAFSRGPSVRRTVVLAVSSDPLLGAPLAARFRQQLAASGTALYVLDAAPSGAPAYDALAAGSGGSAFRVRAPGAWSAAFAQITADLSEQYYLRFTDQARLPGRVRILVRTPKGVMRGAAELPVANPVAPAPLPVVPEPHVQPPRQWDRPLVWLAALLIIIGVGYGIGMLAASRRDPRRRAALPSGSAGHSQADPAAAGTCPPDLPSDLYFVFLMPCLNEEKVILNSLNRLLSMPADNFVVMVIDDGSDDDTVGVLSRVLGDRVWLLSRKPPHARQGKGEALNAAIRYLSHSEQLAGRDPDKVIVVVVDADGQLDSHAVAAVTPFFADPAIGAVQIGVRINNRGHSRLARMQDMEFVIYTEVFQRGRRHLGSVGLGGNGQFMRLSALQSLGPAPWTRSLTDDLDLGVRLLSAGWRNEYCSSAAVHQQGVVELRRLIRQRSRWFQGHLQSWKLIPTVLRRAPRRARADLLYHLSSPAILLIASLLSASFLISLANCAVLAGEGRNPLGWWLASTYALTFGPALMFSSVYWGRERDSGMRPLRVVGLAHLYVCYGMMWYASGWWAIGRTLRGRTGWAKTDRVAEVPLQQALPALVSASVSATAVLPTLAAPGANAGPAVLVLREPWPDDLLPGLAENPVTQPLPALVNASESATAVMPALAAPGANAGAAVLTLREPRPDDLRPGPAENPVTQPLPVCVSASESATAVMPAVATPGGNAGPVFSPVPGSRPGGQANAAPDGPAPVPEPPAPSRPRRRRRRRVAAVALAATLACAVSGAVVVRSGILGSDSGHGQWLSEFNGYGTNSVTGSGAQQVITLSPEPAQTRAATHSALVISARWYQDFVATVQVRTVRQLRHGAAGTPNPWEVGWVVWHYTSNQHFYALTLEPTRWVLSKQDPAYPGGERFLASGSTPVFRVGVTHTVGIVQIGNLISVSADGHLLARFTDTQRPYLSGAAGVYSEDSISRFSHIRVIALSPPANGSIRPPAGANGTNGTGHSPAKPGSPTSPAGRAGKP